MLVERTNIKDGMLEERTEENDYREGRKDAQEREKNVNKRQGNKASEQKERCVGGVQWCCSSRLKNAYWIKEGEVFCDLQKNSIIQVF